MTAKLSFLLNCPKGIPEINCILTHAARRFFPRSFAVRRVMTEKRTYLKQSRTFFRTFSNERIDSHVDHPRRSGVRLLRVCPLAREDVGRRPQQADACGGASGRRLRARFQVDGVCAPVHFDYRRGPCDGPDYRCDVRLAPGAPLDARGRRLLRRGAGLHCAIRLCEERRPLDRHDH